MRVKPTAIKEYDLFMDCQVADFVHDRKRTLLITILVALPLIVCNNDADTRSAK